MIITPKVALITGAARRIGAEIARTLHAAGMNIIIHYHLSKGAAEILCEELNKLRRHSAVCLQADLASPHFEAALIEQAVAIWQRLDVLVNNASRYYRTNVEDTTLTSWDDLINTNLRAPFFLSQAASRYLATTSGCIINITDIQAERSQPAYSIYGISKSGLRAMTETLASELAPLIRVNAIAPGPIIWPEGENTLTEEQRKNVIDSTLLLRHGNPLDIAKAALFLARDATFTTGQTLYVDGGRRLTGMSRK